MLSLTFQVPQSCNACSIGIFLILANAFSKHSSIGFQAVIINDDEFPSKERGLEPKVHLFSKFT